MAAPGAGLPRETRWRAAHAATGTVCRQGNCPATVGLVT